MLSPSCKSSRYTPINQRPTMSLADMKRGSLPPGGTPRNSDGGLLQ